MRNTKNYAGDGGSSWIVGGTLEIVEEGELVIKGSPLKQVPHQSDTTATTIEEVVSDFNTLLAKLKEAGIMAKN